MQQAPSPYESTKDVFCIREERTTNAYRRISIDGIELKIPGVDPYEKVDLRIVPNVEPGLTEIRFWYKNRMVSTQKIKSSELKRIHL